MLQQSGYSSSTCSSLMRLVPGQANDRSSDFPFPSEGGTRGRSQCHREAGREAARRRKAETFTTNVNFLHQIF